jgi:hypothetical protein
LGAVATGYTIAIPVAAFVLSVWYLQVVHFETGRAQAVFLMAAALILVSPVLGLSIYLVAALMAALVLFDTLTQPGGLLADEESPAAH